MKLFGWFRSGENKLEPVPRIPAKELPEPQRSVFSDVGAEVHEDYEDELHAATRHIAHLEQHIDELEDDLSACRQEIERLKADLLLTRAEATSAVKIGHESKSDQPNFSTAIGQLGELAQEGDPIAQFYVGISYLFGLGNKRNSFLGEHWLTKAASSGESNAQFVLGVLKWHGIFLHRGVQQALHWLNLAGKNQHQEVDKLISEVQSVVRKLNDEKRKAADVLVRAPSSQDLEPPANPGRFNAAEPKNPSLRRASRWNSFDDDEINATQIARTPGSRVRPEDDYHGVQRDAYALGRRLGRQCLKRAARFNRLMTARVEDLRPRDLKGLARRFAMRRGYLQNSITEGMEQLMLPEYEITPELRDIFIKGVKRGIEWTKAQPIRSARLQL
jgi:hypothetical protein